MSRIEVKTTVEGQTLKVSLAGAIDETFSQSCAQIPKAENIEFNLAGLKSINSTGIREWIKYSQSLTGSTISFVHCPKVFIDQVNMVQGFIPAGSKINSFYVPYYNEDNDTEKNVLFTYGKEFSDATLTLPAGVKDDTGAPMEIDIIESKYFKFIKGS
jgi:hypothetical protein